MSSKRKNPINPGNIGDLFIYGDELMPYRLIKCTSEPVATMRRVNSVDEKDDVVGEISGFASYIHLKEDRPRATKAVPITPNVRKERSDKGKEHKKPQAVTE